LMNDDQEFREAAFAHSEDSLNVVALSDEECRGIKGRPGQNLYQLLVGHGYSVENACGGRLTCGKCKVKIVNEAPEATIEELEVLTETELDEGVRLACGVLVREGMEVVLENKRPEVKILGLEGNLDAPSCPRVSRFVFDWNPGTLDDQRDALTRIQTAGSGQKFELSLNALKEIAALTAYDSKLPVGMVLYNHSELLGITNDPNCYGIAVDLGTTTIAATLINLTQGLPLETVTGLNNQKTYGGDVISRIHYTMHDKNGIEILQQSVTDGINDMILRLCDKAGISKSSVYEITLSGNTTMLHLLLGVPCGSLAVSPFIAGFTDSVRVKAKEAGLNIHPEGYLLTLPAVSAYIGGDTVGAIQATRLFEAERSCLLVDIGTNGEIVLGNRDWMIACSAAAGPAFEGASIRHGTGGIEGAIDHVNLETEEIYTTIGRKKPLGICGSGIVDLVAQLKRIGLLEETGRMLGPDELDGLIIPKPLSERVLRIAGVTAFMLDFEREIYVSQRDIREVQLAKSAIRSGIEILLTHAGIVYEDIDKVYIAGGFGNYMSIESAAAIGLIPEELKHKCVSADNAALRGAAIVLMDENAAVMNGLHKRIRCIEMSGDPRFQELFMAFMSL
jgi:uncharacterized 2Fe-2S/4Fe-4S cluster protein (DUF4445 family)